MNFLRVFPTLGVRDMDAAVAFYRDVLGFTVTWQWGTPPARVGVARGMIELQLLGDPRLRPATPGQVYVHMTGIETDYREICAGGAQVSGPLVERDWGMKNFRVLDPSDFQPGFAEERSSASP